MLTNRWYFSKNCLQQELSQILILFLSTDFILLKENVPLEKHLNFISLGLIGVEIQGEPARILLRSIGVSFLWLRIVLGDYWSELWRRKEKVFSACRFIIVSIQDSTRNIVVPELYCTILSVSSGIWSLLLSKVVVGISSVGIGRLKRVGNGASNWILDLIHAELPIQLFGSSERNKLCYKLVQIPWLLRL